MTRIITVRKNARVIREVKDIKYDGRTLAEVDYTETTAFAHFCRIRFVNSNEGFWIPSHRLEVIE